METANTTSLGGAAGLRDRLAGLIRERRYADAVATADAARRAHPGEAWFATMHGFALLNTGRPAEALEAANAAIGGGAADATTLYVAGVASGRLGRHADAARALLGAYQRLPDRVDIACLLLEATTAAHGLNAARSHYETAAARISDRKLAACWARLQFRQGAEDHLPPGFAAAPLMSVPDWAGRSGVAMDWVGEREPLPWVDPVIAGEPDAPRRRSSFLGYAPYVCTLHDATVFSKSNMVLTADGAALNDTTADPEYGRYVTNFMSELTVSERRGERLLLDLGRCQLTELDTPVLHLAGSVSEHFGHWISEFLPRLHYMQHHPRFADLPVLVDRVMPPQHLEYLRLVIPNPVIELPPGAGFRCRELVVAAPAAFFPVHLTGDHKVPPEKQQPISPRAFRYIRERVEMSLPPSGRTDRKVYLSRKLRGGRRPLNEDAISAFLADRGFEVVIPEQLSFADQVRLFQEAGVVVASNGSSLMNAIFSPPGTEFYVLSQRGIFNWGLFCGWMAEFGHRVTFICCAHDTGRKHDNYEVSLDELAAGLAFGTRPA